MLVCGRDPSEVEVVEAVKQIAGRVAVVTGAGSGIGRAVALELARRGADLALVDIHEATLSAVAVAVEATGSTASTHLVDVASAEQMAALPEEVVARHGSVELLVNNAGVSVDMPFEEQSMDDLRWITGINYWGVVHGCRYFLGHLKQAEEAHIVNVSSSAGLTGMKGQGSYAATKFAIRGLSESLYVELAHSSVGITCVHPGAVSTDILRSARMDPGQRQRMLRLFRYAMAPEKAARLIVRAVEKDRFELVFGAESRAIRQLKRVAPVGTLKLMRMANRPDGRA